jgi:hypothetical protein
MTATPQRLKQSVSLELKAQVIELRRSHSLADVAQLTGLPLGTVKTLVSRSGQFRDNPVHRAMFSLPAIQVSTETLPATVDLPEQRNITGDREIDVVLWLRDVIGTGQAALIEKAMLARKRIVSTMEVLEKKYQEFLIRTNPGNPFAALSSFGFADLNVHAKRSIQRATLCAEARSRFGDTLFAETDAEIFCVDALHGVPCELIGTDKLTVADRFRRYPALMPQTLSDCLHELRYWRDLYFLRNAVEGYGDPVIQATMRDGFTLDLMAEIRPRSKDEAIAVIRYLAESGRLSDQLSNSLLENLIGR